MIEYRKLLEGLRLRHFTADEILVYGERWRGSTQNSLPTSNLLQNIIEPLWVLDHVREITGKPIKLLSSYRSPEYNEAVGGASKSLHMQNKALDFRSERVSARKLYNIVMKLRDAGMFKGGVGLYDNFVHIDTRGRNTQW